MRRFLLLEVVTFALLVVAVVAAMIFGKALYDKIQEQRAETIIRACEQSNMRNRAAKEYSNIVADSRIEENPQDAEGINQARFFLILLVDALSPVTKDCRALARENT